MIGRLHNRCTLFFVRTSTISTVSLRFGQKSIFRKTLYSTDFFLYIQSFFCTDRIFPAHFTIFTVLGIFLFSSEIFCTVQFFSYILETCCVTGREDSLNANRIMIRDTPGYTYNGINILTLGRCKNLRKVARKIRWNHVSRETNHILHLIDNP